MITVRLSGGLGNQLFQYAYGRSLSIAQKRPLYLDIRDIAKYGQHTGYALDSYKISAVVANDDFLKKFPEWKRAIAFRLKKIMPVVFNVSHENNNKQPINRENILYIGYWQDQCYFSNIRDVLLEDLSLKKEMTECNLAVLNHMKSVDSVSVHIRRGDYLSNSKATLIYEECSVEYYKKAFEYISDKIKEPFFFVFSDDIEWCHLNIKFGKNIVYVSNSLNSAQDDLFLMSSCKNHIIANSTFSWWGAWLNPSLTKIQIAPKKWFKVAALSVEGLFDNSWKRF